MATPFGRNLQSITLLIVNFRCCGYHHYGEYLDYIKLLVAAVTQTAQRPFCSAPAAAGRRRMQYKLPREQVKTIIFRYIFIYYNRVRIYTRNPLGLPPARYREWAQAQQAA